MEKLYMGIDAGSLYMKGVIIDEYDNIIASSYEYIESNAISSVKKIIKNMKKMIDLNKYQVVSVGVTGLSRKFIGTLLGASIIKNEITANAKGITRLYPKVKTIFEIGGQNSKVTLINNGIVHDYAINTLCSSGTGSFLESLARRMNISINDISNMALSHKNDLNITSRCSVFAFDDLLHKIQEGYKKEDILYGCCKFVALNYINNVLKGKKIHTPIVFTGGVSKNEMVLQIIEEYIGEKIIVPNNSHLMSAFGVALMAREIGVEKAFDFEIDNYKLETKMDFCKKCNNNCEIITVYKNDKLIDSWGYKCDNVERLQNI